MSNASEQQTASSIPHRIVVVGGGAGGLELVTALGDKFGRRGRVDVTLVDRSPTHLWKPLLHEVAAGAMDVNTQALDYAAQARWHRFTFQQGNLKALDRAQRMITIDAVLDTDGFELLPQREIPYDTLVLAIGSVTNFFSTPGAAEYATALDTQEQAEHFRRRMIAACMRADLSPAAQVNIVIIGGGATGVELSAELRNTAEVLAAYGMHRMNPRHDVRITIVEAASRLLSALPERVSHKTGELLHKLDISVLTGEKVSEIRANEVLTANALTLPADLTVWAAGIRAPTILGELGLPVNRLGQVTVRQSLRTEVDPDIFAFGDCAACPWPEKDSTVPPRAQAAHQQATFLFDALKKRLDGQPLPDFHYRDLGSLVSLGRYDAVGNLMGPLIGSTLFIEGLLARMIYFSLYRMHLVALHGWVRTAAETIGQWLQRRTAPRVKLH